MKVQAFALATFALAALTLQASAAETCRRFVPSAGITVEVPCIETASIKEATPATPAIATAVTTPIPAVATPAPVAAAKVAPVAPAAQDAKAIEKAGTATGEKPVKTVETTRDAKRCGDILDRAQSGKVSASDLAVLRNQCRT
jgi:hypothetical protein